MKLYKSDKLRDVAFQVIESGVNDKDRTIDMRVAWWRWGKKNMYPMGIEQSIRIPIDKWDTEFYSVDTKDWIKAESNQIPYIAEDLTYEE
jgi:hypothetical protein